MSISQVRDAGNFSETQSIHSPPSGCGASRLDIRFLRKYQQSACLSWIKRSFLTYRPANEFLQLQELCRKLNISFQVVLRIHAKSLLVRLVSFNV